MRNVTTKLILCIFFIYYFIQSYSVSYALRPMSTTSSYSQKTVLQKIDEIGSVGLELHPYPSMDEYDVDANIIEMLYTQITAPEVSDILFKILHYLGATNSKKAMQILDQIHLVRSDMAGINRCVDDELIKVLPDIAITTGSPEVFLKTLYIESKLFRLFLKKKPVLKYEIVCRSFHTVNRIGIQEALFIEQTFFSLAKSIFTNNKELVNFILTTFEAMKTDPDCFSKFSDIQAIRSYIITAKTNSDSPTIKPARRFQITNDVKNLVTNLLCDSVMGYAQDESGYTESGVRIESDRWHLDAMLSPEKEKYFVEALSELFIGESADEYSILYQLVAIFKEFYTEETINGKTKKILQVIDDNLIKNLPTIVSIFSNHNDFINALYIESKLFRMVSGINTVFSWEGYCPDAMRDLGGIFRAWVFHETVFSIYSEYFKDAEDMINFVNNLAIKLREDTGLAEVFLNKEAFIGYIKSSQIHTPNPEKIKVSKKCLVVDCDGTLWGGIVGEDGIDNIILDDFYLAFQKRLLDLKNQGFILAISSKNDTEHIKAVFDRRKEMVLKWSDFAVSRINYNDKASNIKSMAEELGISTDSMVFLDDSPRERNLVRYLIPDVFVPELPINYPEYAEFIDKLSLDVVKDITEEDRARTGFYLATRDRAKHRMKFDTLGEYLHSLKMELQITQASDKDIARVAQLTQRTHQFNLTAKHYSKDAVQELFESSLHRIFVVRHKDIFGDSGLVGVIILKKHIVSERWEIDTFCMSCRVLGLNVETTFINRIITFLKKEGFKEVVGIYVQTVRNKLFSKFYEKIGFKQSDVQGDISSYILDIKNFDFVESGLTRSGVNTAALQCHNRNMINVNMLSAA